MKIEAGKFYRTRDGDIERIAEINPTRPYGRTHPFIADSGRSYREDGCYLESAEKCGADLVAELGSVGEGVVETGGCAPPVIVDPVERAINPPVFIDLTSGAVNVVGAPPAGPVTPPEPSNRQLASALRLLVREADRHADDDLRLADAIVLAESVLDRIAP